MLDFAEAVQREVRKLRKTTEEQVLGHRVISMEQYKQLMGRLEGYTFVEDAIRQLLEKNPDS
jgi:methyl coenzyme M reductase gamma subunit